MSDFPDFKKLRFDPNHHLGMGDVRITIAQQEAITDRIAELEAENEKLVHACRIGAKHMDRVEELEEVIATFEKGRDRDGERIEELEAENERLRKVAGCIPLADATCNS